jgi:ComF family protein
MKFSEYFSDFIGLFFPKICASCDNPLVRNERFLCTKCLCELPKTNFQTNKENEVAKIFWGRVLLENATAHFYFQKGGHVQKLLHKLKYKNQKEIGIELGKIIGYDLAETPFSFIDLVVPVPLHKSRLRKRGYNQSEYIALGISQVMGKPLDKKTLLRSIANPSQTRKHRYERWMNVDGIFNVNSFEKIANKHILLVDDVITTGATLEACVHALQSVPNIKVSIAVVAMA